MLTEEEFNNLSKDEKAEYLRRSKGVQGLEDLEYFCHNVLGYDDIDPEVHGELIKRLTNGSRKKLILLPRGSFKSSISTICWPIWSFLKNPDIRILIDSEVLENSQKFVNQIKTHLGNPEFKVTYGNLLDGRERLTAREFTVSSRENRKLKEPTVYATGIGTVNVGMHYDLIIADDLHSEKNVGTKEQID